MELKLVVDQILDFEASRNFDPWPSQMQQLEPG